MTHIEQAIRDAEKGGYTYPSHSMIGETFSRIFLDPTFWQALGKARGWKEDEKRYGTLRWHFEAMRFMQHLMFGKDAESFFASLATPTPPQV